MTESNNELLEKLVARWEKPAEKVEKAEDLQVEVVKKDDGKEELEKIRGKMREMFFPSEENYFDSQLAAASNERFQPHSTGDKDEPRNNFQNKMLTEGSSTISSGVAPAMLEKSQRSRKQVNFSAVWRDAFENKRNKAA